MWVSTNCLPYDFNPSATCPRWEQFIHEVFPHNADDGQADLLQEWFGYCLTSDTSLQKFMLWTGVGCNGKGTTWEVLKGLIGDYAAGGFSLFELVSVFGLSPLVNKSVAYCGEAELKGCRDRSKILDNLKGIVGEDTRHINKKYDPDGLTLSLPTRLIIACNELPMLYETGGAFARRLQLLRFDECFQGREDFDLKNKLKAELPGIANWALQGLVRLRSRGRFAESEAIKTEIDDYRRNNSTEYAFIQDCLIVSKSMNPGNLSKVIISDDDSISIGKEAVQNAYRAWCLENDYKFEEDKPWRLFWQSIAQIIPRIRNGKKGRRE